MTRTRALFTLNFDVPTATAPSTSPVRNPSTQAAPTGRDPALDGLRGVAVLLVYVFHYGGGLQSPHMAARFFGYLTQAGWIGVEIFFALSGFLITGLFWPARDQPGALRGFFARRARRILPIYLGVLAAAACAALIANSKPGLLQPFLIYLVFLQNVPPLGAIALRFPPPLPLHHLWTIAVEAQFYLLWPFLLLAARTRRRALQYCGWTFALACLFRTVVFWPGLTGPGMALDWSPFLLTRLGAMALGSALSLIEPADRLHQARRWAPLVLLLSLLLFLTVGYHYGSLLLFRPGQFIFSLPVVELACAAMLALSLVPGTWRSALSWQPLDWLGRISYGFYVLHILLEPVFDRIGTAVSHAHAGTVYLVVRFLVAFPVSAIAAWVSFRFVEQPLLRDRPPNQDRSAVCCIQGE